MSTATPAAQTPAATPLPTVLLQSWRLEFERSGGIAGLSQRLTLDDSGQGVFADLRRDRRVNGSLTPAEMAELRVLLANAWSQAQPASQTQPCADCFEYSLSFNAGSREETVRANSLGVSPRLRPLVQWLTTLLEGRLAP